MTQKTDSPTARRLPRIVAIAATGALALGAALVPAAAFADIQPAPSFFGPEGGGCACVVSDPDVAAQTGCCLRPDVP